MPLDLSDRRIQLSVMLGSTITQFTARTPMEIGEILEALAFTAGHALAQKAAKKFSEEKDLRETVIRSLDRGIREGNAGDTGPKLILPN